MFATDILIMEKMKKLFDFNIFGHDRPILKFTILISTILLTSLLGRFLFSLTEGSRIDWEGYILYGVILILLSSISYFFARLFAYKTKLFSRMERDNVLIITFFGLLLILGALLVILLVIS